jgi:hypothetical protein
LTNLWVLWNIWKVLKTGWKLVCSMIIYVNSSF